MAKTRKTWREKLLDDKDLPRVEPIEGKLRTTWGEGTFVIPAPREVDALMRQVRKGKLTTIAEIRAALAARHGATICCPLTAGIFSWIAAHAAQEALDEGATRVTPYWRTLKAGGELNPKYPGGIERVKALLESEGHTVTARGKRWFVEGYEKKLAKLKAADIGTSPPQ